MKKVIELPCTTLLLYKLKHLWRFGNTGNYRPIFLVPLYYHVRVFLQLGKSMHLIVFFFLNQKNYTFVVLEMAKVDVLLAEKELSSLVTRMINNLLIKPCVLTVSTISEMAEW